MTTLAPSVLVAESTEQMGEEISCNAFTLIYMLTYMSSALSALLHIKSGLIKIPACAMAKLIHSVSQRGLLVVPFQYS